MFDRAAILRDAHAEARRRAAPCHYQRHGDRFDAGLRAWVPIRPYRAILGTALKATWHAFKLVAAEEARAYGLPAIPADIVAEAAAMRADAWFEPISATGNARLAATLAAASALLESARSRACHA